MYSSMRSGSILPLFRRQASFATQKKDGDGPACPASSTRRRGRRGSRGPRPASPSRKDRPHPALPQRRRGLGGGRLDERTAAAQAQAADADHLDAVAQLAWSATAWRSASRRPGSRPPRNRWPCSSGRGRPSKRRAPSRPVRSVPRGPFQSHSFQAGDDGLGRLLPGRRLVVDHDRGDAARADAAGRQQRQPVVRRRLAGPD